MTSIRTLSITLLVLLSIPYLHAQGTQENKSDRTELAVAIAASILIPVGILAVMLGMKKRNAKIDFDLIKLNITNANHAVEELQTVLPSYEQMGDDELQQLLIARRPRSSFVNIEELESINSREANLTWYAGHLQNDTSTQAMNIKNAITTLRPRVQKLKIRIAGLTATQNQRALLAQKELIPPAPVTNTYVSYPTQPVVYVRPQPYKNREYTYHWDRVDGSSYTIKY